jgi:hypothetical protein
MSQALNVEEPKKLTLQYWPSVQADLVLESLAFESLGSALELVEQPVDRQLLLPGEFAVAKQDEMGPLRCG